MKSSSCESVPGKLARDPGKAAIPPRHSFYIPRIAAKNRANGFRMAGACAVRPYPCNANAEIVLRSFKNSNPARDFLECGGLPALFCALNKGNAGACSRFDHDALKEPRFLQSKNWVLHSAYCGEKPRKRFPYGRQGLAPSDRTPVMRTRKSYCDCLNNPNPVRARI